VTSSTGAFDTKLKVKHRNHIEEKFDNEFTEVTLEKLTPWSGIELFAGHRRGTGFFAPYEGKFNTSRAGEAFAGLSFPLLRDRKLDQDRLQLKASQIDSQVSENELLIKKNFYIYKGLSLYQKWRFTYQKIQTLKDLLKIAIERQVMLEKRFKAGDLEKIKLKDNLRSQNKREEELLKAEMDFKKHSIELSLYFRDKNGVPVETSGYTPSGQSEVKSPSLMVISNLPQMKIIDLEIEINRQNKAFGENLKLPVLNVSGQVARELSSDYPFDPEKVYLSINFELPLENRKGEGKTVASVYKGMALEKKKQWIADELKARYEQTKELHELAQKRASVMTEEHSNASAVAVAERKRWSSGDSDLFVVAIREQEAADVEVKLWGAKYDLEQYSLDLDLYSARFVQK